MKFSGKIHLMIILKVTKKGFDHPTPLPCAVLGLNICFSTFAALFFPPYIDLLEKITLDRK